VSLVYHVAAGSETPGEPSAGWYYVDAEGEPHGPYMSRDNALGFAAERAADFDPCKRSSDAA
jgi:hypothetical protein